NNMKKIILILTGFILTFALGACSADSADEQNNANENNENNEEANNNQAESDEDSKQKEDEKTKEKYEFERPETVRGIYSTGHVAGGERFETLTDLIDDTDLNSMVIDIKDDEGYITYEPDEDSEFADAGQPYIDDPEDILETLQEKEIYPIARIVVFKDSVMAENDPDMSFLENGQVWKNGSGDAFV